MKQIYDTLTDTDVDVDDLWQLEYERKVLFIYC